MATQLPEISSGTLVTAADWWNPQTKQVNKNSSAVETLQSQASALRTDVTSLQSVTNDSRKGNAALGDRAYYLEQDMTAQKALTGSSVSGNAALDTRLSTVESRTTNATTGNSALGTRVSSLEAGGGSGSGGAGAIAGYLSLDPNVKGFQPSGTNTYEVYSAQGGQTYIQFANPGYAVTVYGAVQGHAYCVSNTRGGHNVDISFDGGVTWRSAPSAPLVRLGTVDTTFVGAQFAYTGTPTGPIRVRALAMRENSVQAIFYRTSLYAQLIPNTAFTTG